MSNNKTYTYRCGEKVELEKSTDEIVVRALPQYIDDAAVVSSARAGTDQGRLNRWAIELSSM